VCQRCPVLAECREWTLSGRYLLGTIVGRMTPDAQPTVSAADERARRRWIVGQGFHGAVDGHHPGLVGHEADEGRLRDL
jgi:hypothetical protein